MLRVDITLIPFGVESNARILNTVFIHNDGTGTKTRGNYSYSITSREGLPLAQGSIKNFPRDEKTARDLLSAVLQDAEQHQEDTTDA